MQTALKINTTEVYTFFGIQVYLSADGAQMISAEAYNTWGHQAKPRTLNEDLKKELIKL